MNKQLILLVIAFFIGISICHPIADLTEETYDDYVRKNEFTFMMLYAPWCGYCGQFKPDFEKAANLTDKFHFGRVDCTVEMKLCSRLKVNYYPTLTFFKYGHSLGFDGEKSPEAILEWMEKYSRFYGPRLNSKEEIEEFRKNYTYHSIGYFSDESTNAFKNFQTAWERRTLYQTPSALVTDPSLFDGRKDGTVDVFNSQFYNPIVLPLDTEISYQSIADLTSKMFVHSFPPIIEIDDTNYQRYRQLRRNLYLGWIDLESPTKDADLNVLRELAAKYPQFSFGYVDYQSKKERLYKLGAVKTHVNTIVRIDFQSEDSYIYELPNPHNTQSISKWIDGIIKGEVQPNILSEEIPATQDGPVQKIVGLNFNDVVLDNTKDVFVQYYIDWCDGCKYHESFDKVGAALKGIDDVVIGKLDYNINDVREMHLEIYGNPTFALYLRNDKEHPIQYSGSQTSDDLLRFFKKHTLSQQAKQVPDLPREEPPKFDDADVIDVSDEGEVIVNKKGTNHDEL